MIAWTSSWPFKPHKCCIPVLSELPSYLGTLNCCFYRCVTRAVQRRATLSEAYERILWSKISDDQQICENEGKKLKFSLGFVNGKILPFFWAQFDQNRWRFTKFRYFSLPGGSFVDLNIFARWVLPTLCVTSHPGWYRKSCQVPIKRTMVINIIMY